VAMADFEYYLLLSLSVSR